MKDTRTFPLFRNCTLIIRGKRYVPQTMEDLRKALTIHVKVRT